jgi:hypothetical protein
MQASSFRRLRCARAAEGDFDRGRGARPNVVACLSRALYAARKARISFGCGLRGALNPGTMSRSLAEVGPRAHSASR